MKAKLGAPAATTAAAHKLARVLYAMIKFHKPYDPARIGNPALRRTRKENALRRAAKELGFDLRPIQAVAVSRRSEIGVDLLESPLSKTGFWSRPEETGLPRGVGARGCRGDSAVGQAIHRRYNGAFKPV